MPNAPTSTPGTVARPCYCAMLASGQCDFCTGLAAENGPRWNEAISESEAPKWEV